MFSDKDFDKPKPNVLCLVSYNILPAKMGGQKGIALFYEFYASFVNITCVTTKNNDPSVASYPVLNILSNSPLRYINVFYFFLLRNIIKQKKITHLQIEHPYYGWLAWLVRLFCNVRLVVHSHNIEGLRFKSIGKPWWRLLLWYEKKTYRLADYLFFKTDEDRQYAIAHFNINPSQCLTAPYGISWAKPTTANDKLCARQMLLKQHSIIPASKILLFNGAFNYKPNLDALFLLLNQVNPLLAAISDFDYTLLICGKGIPASITTNTYPNVLTAGFVQDISAYFKGADVFLNPTDAGGGIKTKLVEALAYDLSSVSFKSGAIGIPLYISGKMLTVVTDGDAHLFAEAVVAATQTQNHIPKEFFDFFYWGNITKKAADFITRDV